MAGSRGRGQSRPHQPVSADGGQVLRLHAGIGPGRETQAVGRPWAIELRLRELDDGFNDPATRARRWQLARAGSRTRNGTERGEAGSVAGRAAPQVSRVWPDII
jgi:hypothetical protein